MVEIECTTITYPAIWREVDIVLFFSLQEDTKLSCGFFAFGRCFYPVTSSSAFNTFEPTWKRDDKKDIQGCGLLMFVGVVIIARDM